jgi:two-component system, OmpR family, phosphate regulon sensor histidine kinase PhoR
MRSTASRSSQWSATATAARVRAASDSAASAAAALDALPDAIIELDANQKVIRANAAARDDFGAEAGLDVAAVIRDPDVLASIEDALAGRETATVAHLRPGAVERHFEVVVLKPRLLAGAQVSALVVFHDVTALRRATELRVDFVANVSHELRTPLTALIGFIETLRGPARDDAGARSRFLGIMHDESQRMSRLVSDLLSLSRIEAMEHTPPTEMVALTAVLGRAADALAMAARAKNMRIVVDAEPGLPAVQGDADQLLQVFQNLVDNAIKYGRADTEVRIAARRVPGDGVAVSVADTGDGIGREHLARLTERFYRVDAGRSRRMGGTGLGLAIVKHIVNRHRATLAIDSEPGRGSVFTVSFQSVAGASGED